MENVYLRAQHHDLVRQLTERDHHIGIILASRTWRIAKALQRIRLVLAPQGSRREQLLYILLKMVQILRHEGVGALFSAISRKVLRKTGS